MANENSLIIFITFLLAVIGYAGLTITLLLALYKKIFFLFWRIIVFIITTHVFMVWSFHYEWDFSFAVRNGYSGFLIFHSALLIILLSAFIKESLSRILIIIAFILVTTGAAGAVFRYEVVGAYKLPVLLSALSGISGLIYSIVKKYLNRIIHKNV
jgi:hypothetical protein